jgi:hypothetical protein
MEPNLNITSPNEINTIYDTTFSFGNPLIFNDPSIFTAPAVDLGTRTDTNFRSRIENILFLLNRINRIDDNRSLDNNNNNNRPNNYRRMNTSYVNQTPKYIDPYLIPELKKKIIIFNDKKYSFHHLCQLNLTFRNKFNVLLNIDFSAKKVLLKCKYIIKINILDKETKCNNLKCDENFCDGKSHLSSKNRKLLLNIEDFSAEKLMETLEEKIQDYKYCIECTTLWDIKHIERIIDDENDLDICDNCVFKKHINEKTLKEIEKCSICLKTIYENDFRKTLCKHYFHKECIETWLIKKNSCPLCRCKLKNNEYQYDQSYEYSQQIIEEL